MTEQNQDVNQGTPVVDTGSPVGNIIAAAAHKAFEARAAAEQTAPATPPAEPAKPADTQATETKPAEPQTPPAEDGSESVDEDDEVAPAGETPEAASNRNGRNDRRKRQRQAAAARTSKLMEMSKEALRLEAASAKKLAIAMYELEQIKERLELAGETTDDYVDPTALKLKQYEIDDAERRALADRTKQEVAMREVYELKDKIYAAAEKANVDGLTAARLYASFGMKKSIEECIAQLRPRQAPPKSDADKQAEANAAAAAAKPLVIPETSMGVATPPAPAVGTTAWYEHRLAALKKE